jgi:transcriptional regulator with XRE-family HTH domain
MTEEEKQQKKEELRLAVIALKKAVGENVASARKRAGFSNPDAPAKAIGVTKGALYELEAGDNWLSPEMAVRLSELYGVPPASFLPGFGEKIAPTEIEALAVITKALKAPPKLEAVPHEPLTAEQVELLRAFAAAVPSSRDRIKRNLGIDQTNRERKADKGKGKNQVPERG